MRKLIPFVSTSLVLGISAMSSANLLVNGGFETGDFTGWTQWGDTGYTGVVNDPGNGALGTNNYAYAGPVTSLGGIEQTVATVAGASYTLNAYMWAGGDDPSDWILYWNGTELVNYHNPNSGGVWALQSFTVVGTGSDTVKFGWFDSPWYVFTDEVSLTAVPEPVTLAVLGIGAAALLRRRRK